MHDEDWYHFYLKIVSFIPHPDSRFTKKGKRFFIESLERHQDLAALLREIAWVFNNPQTYEVVLYYKSSFRPFPNILAPLACAIDHLRDRGKTVRVIETYEEIEVCRYQAPLTVKTDIQELLSPVGRVWRFDDPKDVYAIVDHTIDYLSRHLLWEPGTLHSLEWSMYELLDNVFQHSSVGRGYFMFQVQQQKRRLSFAIADQGRGIQESFRGSSYQPASAADAITLAVQRGVTRDANSNMGNGLWGSAEIAARSKGQITISSGGAAIYFNRLRGNAIAVPRVPVLDKSWPGTVIDVQVDASVSVDVAAMFGKLAAPVNLRIENMEDDSGCIVVDVKQMRIGAGTRFTGEAARVNLLNLINASDRMIAVDLSGVGIISSSFADECFGKLYKTLGAELFDRRIAFRGVSDAVNVVIRNAIAQRCAAG